MLDALDFYSFHVEMNETTLPPKTDATSIRKLSKGRLVCGTPLWCSLFLIGRDEACYCFPGVLGEARSGGR